MELFLFLSVMTALGVGCFCVLGFLYGLIHRPAVLFPPKLAVQMAFAAAIGAFFFGFGAIVLPTWLMAKEFGKRPDYNPTSVILAGLVISALASGITVYSAFWIAPAILD